MSEATDHGAWRGAASALRLADLAAAPLAPVEVAIIDSGIDATHPDLAGRVARAIAFERVEGRIQPIVAEGAQNHDLFGHGTAVAGIIARLAPHARLIDLRVLGPGNQGPGEALVAALALAVRERWPVVNMSLAASAPFAPRLRELCERAFYQGQIIVAARRNVPVTDEGFPAEFSSVLGVDRARFADPFRFRFRDGRLVEIEARGEAVPTLAPGGGYTSVTGTSFATPAVSAIVACLKGADPVLRPDETRALLRALGTAMPGDQTGANAR